MWWTLFVRVLNWGLKFSAFQYNTNFIVHIKPMILMQSMLQQKKYFTFWLLRINFELLQNVLIINFKSIKVNGGFVLFALDIFSNAWNSWLAEADGYLLCFTATMEQRNWKVLNKGYIFVTFDVRWATVHSNIY